MDDTPYASNLQRLETELQEEERAVALETEALQLRLDTLTQKSVHLELESKSLDLDEQNYFDSFNGFKKDLKCHVDQRDAVVTQVEQVGRQLVRMAQRTNPKTVYCV
jgi:GAF domain-containing protein